MLVKADQIITPKKEEIFNFKWTFIGEDKTGRAIVIENIKVDTWPKNTGNSVSLKFYGHPKELKKLIRDVQLVTMGTLKVFDMPNSPNNCMEEWDYDGLSVAKYESKMKDPQYIMSALVKGSVMIITFDFYDVYHTDHYHYQISP